MRANLLTHARRHPLRTALLAFAISCLLGIAAVHVVRWAHWRAFENAARGVASVPPSGRGRIVALHFTALGRPHSVYVRVDDAELEALQRFPAEDAFRYRGAWRERFVTTLVAMQAESRFIDNLAAQLRLLGHRHRLDDDQYLELMTAAIQSIPYVPPQHGVRTPAEVVFDGQGICTEKSITLAALMVHEGYDTVLWSFRSQRHVALGVACPDGASFRGTGYAFIETTRPAFIGEVDRAYRSSGPIHRPPEQIHLGGTRQYGAGREVAYILRVLEDARRTSRRPPAFATSATSGKRDAELAEQLRRRARACMTVDFITTNVHDRARVYRTLCERREAGRVTPLAVGFR